MILFNLFHAYKIIKDKNFGNCIKTKEQEFYEGGNIKPEQLMKIALNVYRGSSKAHTWGISLEEDQCIVTFTSTVEGLKKESENLKKFIN